MNRVQPSLRRFVLLFEAEAACRDRLRASGMPEAIASEVAFYLAQGTDLQAQVAPLAAAFAATGVELLVVPLDDTDRWLPLLAGAERDATLVWCLTDGFAYYRGSFASSAAALFGVAQFGSPPEAQHLAQDKFRCVALAQALGVRTPPTVLVEDGTALSPTGVLPPTGPLFVKPNRLGAKLGIEADSRAGSLLEALALAGRIHARYGDRAVVQAFVPGEDVRVSFMDLGGGHAQLGLYAVDASTACGFTTLADSRRVASLRDAGPGLALANLRADPARARSAAALEDAARRIAAVAPLRDYFSLDFRLDPHGTPWFLEFEVCPAVTIYDFLSYLRDAYGTDLVGALPRAAAHAFARRRSSSGATSGHAAIG